MNPLFKVFSIIETIVAGQDKGVTYSEIVAGDSLLSEPGQNIEQINRNGGHLGTVLFKIRHVNIVLDGFAVGLDHR